MRIPVESMTYDWVHSRSTNHHGIRLMSREDQIGIMLALGRDKDLKRLSEMDNSKTLPEEVVTKRVPTI